MTDGEHQDIAALLKRVMGETGMSQSDIAERSGIHMATLNAWVTRRRAPGRGPRTAEMLRSLAGALPGITVAEIFEAAGRRVPAGLSPEGEQRMLAIYRGLSPARQRLADQVMETLSTEQRSV